MTVQEKIEEINLQNALRITNDWLSQIQSEELKYKEPCFKCGEMEAIKKALEKQIPKKPIENGMRSGIFATHKYYTCPRCGNACLQKMANERQNTNYCWDCGQALKWGEEE
jgi:predicted RNA-binding Zn-ribbon protein involved in translation (DUF1610 family)